LSFPRRSTWRRQAGIQSALRHKATKEKVLEAPETRRVFDL